MENNKKMRGKAGAGILLLTILIITGVLLIDINAQATVVRMGTVINTDTLNYRNGPGTEYDIVGKLKRGDTGEIIGEGTASKNGNTWYKMVVNGVTGWASSSYIKVTEQLADVDKDFEAYLEKQGFPVSYRESLHVLHEKYPNWVFEAQMVEYDWDHVIAEESDLGQNLVSTNSITSWKSTQDGAYNWEAGKWIGLDGSSWVAASQEIIEYYMDPRNFLDSTYVFQFLKQSYSAEGLTAEQLEAKKAQLALVIEDTYLEGSYIENEQEVLYIDVIMEVAASTGVDPLTLASMMIQEQGVKGTGKSITGTVAGYEGYYNYFNVGAYATKTMTAVERGMWYASGSGSNATSYGRPWNTRTASIAGGASYYGQNYVKAGQDTMYLKKFNVQGKNPFTHEYMTNVQGAASEGKHVADGYSEASRKTALVFKIPVFKNMPENPCSKPTGNKDPNYVLKSLSVTGHSLTPTFSYDTTSYSVSVPYETDSITIKATAVSTVTKVSGAGTKKLEVGANTFTIQTTAENGSKGSYKIKIIRKESTGELSFKVSDYKLNEDKTITGIKKFPIDVKDFIKKFSVTNGTIKVTSAKGDDRTGNVGTGCLVKIYDQAGKLKHTYTVVIYGDTNGDGKVTQLDLLRVQKDILNISKLSGANDIAGDTSKDGKINALDLLQVQKQLLNIKAIQQ